MPEFIKNFNDCLPRYRKRLWQAFHSWRRSSKSVHASAWEGQENVGHRGVCRILSPIESCSPSWLQSLSHRHPVWTQLWHPGLPRSTFHHWLCIPTWSQTGMVWYAMPKLVSRSARWWRTSSSSRWSPVFVGQTKFGKERPIKDWIGQQITALYIKSDPPTSSSSCSMGFRESLELSVLAGSWDLNFVRAQRHQAQASWLLPNQHTMEKIHRSDVWILWSPQHLQNLQSSEWKMRCNTQEALHSGGSGLSWPMVDSPRSTIPTTALPQHHTSAVILSSLVSVGMGDFTFGFCFNQVLFEETFGALGNGKAKNPISSKQHRECPCKKLAETSHHDDDDDDDDDCYYYYDEEEDDFDDDDDASYGLFIIFPRWKEMRSRQLDHGPAQREDSAGEWNQKTIPCWMGSSLFGFGVQRLLRVS